MSTSPHPPKLILILLDSPLTLPHKLQDRGSGQQTWANHHFTNDIQTRGYPEVTLSAKSMDM
ncbi:hypothetical protein K439DRAFT_1643046 [Ramaria rubella]|nr:hypothetical protein K439DRAFT_1643046 [Ramaria rubella]